MLGGIPGVRPAKVVVIGAGVHEQIFQNTLRSEGSPRRDPGSPRSPRRRLRTLHSEGGRRDSPNKSPQSSP